MPVIVNDIKISDQEINIESARHDGSIVERQNHAAVALTVRALLIDRAAELNLTAASDDESAVDTLIDGLIEREVRMPDLDETGCRRYYDANRESFRDPDFAQVRHILLAAAPDDAEARDRTRQLGETLIVQLQAEPGRFSELAAAHSACPSRDQNGSLGRIGRGQTVPEFESVVLRLPPGLSPRPLETRYGYHVVWVDAQESGQPLDYAQVRERIADYMKDQGWRQAISQYLQWLSGRAKIKGVNLADQTQTLLS